jgi:hypothetical protein
VRFCVTNRSDSLEQCLFGFMPRGDEEELYKQIAKWEKNVQYWNQVAMTNIMNAEIPPESTWESGLIKFTVPTLDEMVSAFTKTFTAATTEATPSDEGAALAAASATELFSTITTNFPTPKSEDEDVAKIIASDDAAAADSGVAAAGGSTWASSWWGAARGGCSDGGGDGGGDPRGGRAGDGHGGVQGHQTRDQHHRQERGLDRG